MYVSPSGRTVWSTMPSSGCQRNRRRYKNHCCLVKAPALDTGKAHIKRCCDRKEAVLPWSFQMHLPLYFIHRVTFIHLVSRRNVLFRSASVFLQKSLCLTWILSNYVMPQREEYYPFPASYSLIICKSFPTKSPKYHTFWHRFIRYTVRHQYWDVIQIKLN